MTKRLTIEDCKTIAEERRGRCLSPEYKNNRTKLRWQCEHGHIWDAALDGIRGRDYWCPECSGVSKLSIEDCHIVAQANRGRCLSTIYFDNKKNIDWECEFGHRWKASLFNVKIQKTWCPHCAGLAPHTLGDCHKAAEIKRGKCLSTEYKNNRSKMEWECKYGHKWKAAFLNIGQGQWCPKCAGVAKNTLEDCNILAQAKDGICLSDKYINAQTKMEWQCKYFHKWMAKYNDIKTGYWCPICAQKSSTKNSNKISIKYHWKTNEVLYCKASYEPKVVDYLNTNKINYDWQPEPYVCKTLFKNNNEPRLYYPDIYLPDEDKYVEIKGFFREVSKLKWNEFKETYPTAELWDKQKLKDMKIL